MNHAVWQQVCAALGISAQAPNRSHSRWQPRLEHLESRLTFAADIQTFDGTNNNVQHPTWGSDNIDLLRQGPAQYGDGISTPAGANRPSARAISDAVSAQTTDTPNSRDMSAFIYAWGQFIDHDIDLTPGGTTGEKFPVTVPTGDPQFDPNSTGTKTISLTRSLYDAATGTSTSNPRQQINTITAYIDGSMVYGSDATRAAALRTFSGGLLKTSAGNMLPLNTAGLANANDAHLVPDNQLYLAGDVRANENIELLSLQTLFVREHNRLATQIAAKNPTFSDEQIYQQARRLVIGEIQAITYNEFLPALIGDNAIRPYHGYQPQVNPGVTTEFSTAAFRVGHTLLGSDIEFLDNNGNTVHDPVELRDAFFNPGVLSQTGIDPVLKYLSADRAQEVDTKLVDDVRNFLFGPPGAGGFDLASLNIQRGRDHGLEDYNSMRAAYGLPKVTSFDQITNDKALAAQLKSLYGDVNNVDAWVGGLAETHVPGASVGPLFQRVIADQFTRLRDGDRFFYLNTLSPQDARLVDHTSLADVIRNNTALTNLQSDVFFFHSSVSGRVFNDLNNDGKAQPNEAGRAGVVIQLIDPATGKVLQSATTDRNGMYHFDDVGLGSFKVQEVVPTGAKVTSSSAIDLAITRGVDLQRYDFGLQGPKPTTPPPPGPKPAPHALSADQFAALNLALTPPTPGGNPKK